MIPDDVVRQMQVCTVIDLNGFDADSDEAYAKTLFIPNIRRVGGLETIAAAAANGPIWLHHVGNDFDAEWIKKAAAINSVDVQVTPDKADIDAVQAWLAQDRGDRGPK